MSRFPVGSSARIIGGPVISARAIATRCCWPPESCDGVDFSRPARPTRRSASLARATRSPEPTPLSE